MRNMAEKFTVNLVFAQVHFHCLSLDSPAVVNKVNVKVGRILIWGYLISHYKQYGFEASAI